MGSMLAHAAQVQSSPNERLTHDFVTEIERVDLPPSIERIVDEYDEVVGERDRFLWKWIHSLLEEFTLSSVPEDQFEHVRTLKTAFTVFITVLDDLVEKRSDIETFEQARRLPGCRERVDYFASGVDSGILEFTASVWSQIESALVEAPRYDSFQEVFTFDLRQAFNSIDYARLANENLALANLEGAYNYGSHNMVLFPYTDIDLMFSPDFDRSELGTLREVVWEVQEMARIGNWLTTWERELQEGDYTAGTVIYALRSDVITAEELATASAEDAAQLAERIRRANVEEYFLDEWQRRFESVSRRRFDAESVDLDAFVRGMETVMSYHLASQGHK